MRLPWTAAALLIVLQIASSHCQAEDSSHCQAEEDSERGENSLSCSLCMVSHLTNCVIDVICDVMYTFICDVYVINAGTPLRNILGG